MILKSTLQLIILTCVLMASNALAQTDSPSFQIEFRDGTTLTADFVDAQLMWTDVTNLGEMTKKPIDVSRIVSIKLTNEPASAKLAEVLNLINQLDSDDFFEREEAEKLLAKNGRQFKSLIQQYQTLKTSDGTYRIKRLLSKLRSNNKKRQSGYALDILVLDDGTKLKGDIGRENIKFSLRGNTIALPRQNLLRISRANPEFKTRTARRDFVEAKIFHDHTKFRKDRSLKLVDFELQPDGTPLRAVSGKITMVATEFVDFGLLLGTEFPKGCVGISAYPLKGKDKPVGGNSICVFASKTRTMERFFGVMEFTFCQPGKQNVPHGVKDFGMFIGEITHSRDFLIEAYDSLDRLIGVWEANDEPFAFCGFSSSVPIAKVRVLSNPWALELRKLYPDDLPVNVRRHVVDKDYAVDSIMFSKPVPIDSIRKDRHLLGRNGDLIPANRIRILDQDSVEIGSRYVGILNVDLSQTSTVGLKAIPRTLPSKFRNNSTIWMAMLRDNSVLQWNPDSFLQSTTLKRKLSLENVVAIWPAGRQPHMPLAGDFEAGKNVLVYPGCRVATSEISVDDKGFRWNDGEVLMQNLYEANDQKINQRGPTKDLPDKVSPRKKDYSFDTKSMMEFEKPTIWFDRPTSMLSTQGALRLDNGEMLVYGPDAMFDLKSIDKGKVIMTFGGEDVMILLSKVVSIVPPQE